ncbi:MAG: DMT family transporter [Lewinellaceae bacterium]|nr:DMT family transporter [Lewinellaceae bacterium]
MHIYLKALAVACIWGGTFIATRIAAQHLEPFAGAFLRFAFASLGLVALMILRKRPWPRPDRQGWVLHLALALFGIIGYNFSFQCLESIAGQPGFAVGCLKPGHGAVCHGAFLVKNCVGNRLSAD